MCGLVCDRGGLNESGLNQRSTHSHAVACVLMLGHFQKMITAVSDSKLDMPCKRVMVVVRVFVVLGLQNYFRERVFEELTAQLFAGLSKRLLSMTPDDIKK